MSFRRLAFIAASLAVILTTLAPAQAQQAPAKAKYVFLMVGDGMGPAQRSAAEVYLAGPQEDGRPPRVKPLVMNTLPVAGIMRTFSGNSLITDSAAAATAMAAGEKVPNRVVALDKETGRKMTTLAEIAAGQSWKVGIVTSTNIDDATPACFFAHQTTRYKHYEICMELAGSGMEYFAGRIPDGIHPREAKDKPSPIDQARKSGYTIVNDRDALLALKKDADKVFVFWPGEWKPTTAPAAGSDGPPTSVPARGPTSAPAETSSQEKLAEQTEGNRPDGPTLAEITRKGIELLDNPKGFFMMIEGGEIDGYCHQHDLPSAIRETVAFDQAIAEVLEFYKKHADETLVVVLADHETGGLTLGNTGGGGLEDLVKIVDGQKKHSASFGRQIAKFRKEQWTFEQAWPEISAFYGLDEVSERQTKLLMDAYELSMKPPKSRPKDEAFKQTYGTQDPLISAINNLVSRKAGVSWTTYSHTGVSVPVTAVGAGSELFKGYFDNTQVFEKIFSIMAPAK